MADVNAIVDSLPLPQAVVEQVRGVYRRIAQAEARAHGKPVEHIHFHEVGALDAIADIAGVCYALFLLAPERVVVSPIHVGSGTVRCAHGVVPVPAPATAYLLENVPVYGGQVQGELCTPTGAALLTHCATAFGPMPVMCTRQVGIGLGTREFAGAANCLRAFWGEEAEGANGRIAQLVCNLDDMTPEAVAEACQRLLELGALDVYTTPGQMKKGRPGWELTVLCDPEREEEFARHIFTHTSTIGLRASQWDKYFLTTAQEKVDTPYGAVRVKVSQGFGVRRSKPEYEDVRRLAREQGVTFEEVWRSAEPLRTARMDRSEE